MAPHTPPGPRITIPERSLNAPITSGVPVERFHEHPPPLTFTQGHHPSNSSHTKPERSRLTVHEIQSDDSRSRRPPPGSSETSATRKRVIATRVVQFILVAWAAYTTTRYFIAFSSFTEVPLRSAYALALAALSTISFLGNTLVLLFCLTGTFQSSRLHQIVTGVSSVTMLCPSLINVILVATSQSIEDYQSWMSLRGRCIWDIDVIWSGQSGQCEPGVPWGAWLAGAIVRLVLTAIFVASVHLLTFLNETTAKPTSRRRSPSQTALVAPSIMTALSSPVFPYPHSSPTTIQDHQRAGQQPFPHPSYRPSIPQSHASSSTHDVNGTLRSSQDDSDAIGTATSTLTPANYRARYMAPSQGDWDTQGNGAVDVYDTASVPDARELQEFAANFRNMVDQMSRETEQGMRLHDATEVGRDNNGLYPPNHSYRSRPELYQESPSPTSSSSSSPQRYYTPAQELSQTQLQQQHPQQIQSLESDEYDSASDSEFQQQREQFLIQEQHNAMVMEQVLREDNYEHVVVLGGVVRRMSTIMSIGGGSSIGGDRDPWTTSAAGSAQVGISRSPTMSTTRSGVLGPQQAGAPTLSRRNSAPTSGVGLGGNGSDRSRTGSPSGPTGSNSAMSQSSSSAESSPSKKKNTV